MTDITPEQYLAAMQMVAAKDKSVLEDARAVIRTLQDQLAAARESMRGVSAKLPAVSGPPTGVQSNLSSWMGQLNSFEQQTGYMVQAVDSILGQYATGQQPTTNTAPASAPSQGTTA